VKGNIFVAHDVDFDYKFLKAELKKAGLPFNEPKVCTLKLSEKHLQEAESYSLGKLCEEMGIPIPEEVRHRAAGDAVATAKLLGLLLANDE
jgi:DNA polymerase-3 subunit epsilon